MKKKILLRLVLLFGIALVSAALFYKFSIRLESLSLSTDSFKEVESDEAFDDPIKRAEYEFNMIKNPETGKIPEGVFTLEMEQAKQLFAKSRNMRVHANTYTYQGPNNKGGRTRAIAYDVRYNGTTNRIILAGGVSGGVFKSTDDGATWTRKSPTNQLFNITSIAQDPRPGFQDTWYYSTGETIGNSASMTGAPYLGNGIYKSTDNGETWSRLANSNFGALETFDAREDLISKVVVNPTNGDVYAGAMDEIMRSQNGGANWSVVLTSGAGSISTRYLIDLVISSTGIIYAGVSGGSPTGPTIDMPGVWTSTTGNAGSWTKIAGPGGTPVGWNNDGAYGRVVLALAPSNQNILYALYYNNLAFPSKEAEFFMYDASIPAWTDRSANLPDEPGALNGNDPFAVQGGYDLVVTVKSDDPNTVFIGGTNIYRSTDGFATTANTTRIGGYNSPANYALYPNSHSDIHSIVIQPGSSTTMLCGNDGGIQRTTNNLAATVAWTDICTNGYRTYQYYYVTLDPRNANSKVLGGAQDNGSTRNIGGSGSDFELAWSGDGVSVGLSNVIGGNTFEYVGSQAGDIARRNSASPLLSGTNIRPAAATDNGLFVTLFLLDPDNTETLYYASDSSLYRNTSASTATTANWTAMTGIPATIVDGGPPKTQITSLAVTRGTYNPATASLFIGTNEGRIYRLDDPANAAAATAPVNISTGLPAGAYMSSISVNPRNDDTVLVTFSNYGINNVWWTGNANAASPTWLNVEGGLTVPSYRSSAIAVTNAGVEYFVGTSVGLYRAGTINSASPGTTSWTQEGPSDIGNALTSSIALRPVDNRLLIGTHGHGMWATNLSLAITPVNFSSFTGKTEDKSNKLSWKVDNEMNNSGYEVQRKYQGESEFAKIAFVPAKNNNARSNEYSFEDLLVDLGKENTSYRLKQIDVDGNFSYSSVISLQRKTPSKFVEYVSLSGGQLLIRMNSGNANEQITLRLLDMQGRVMQKLKLENKTQQIDISRLPRIAFVVEITHPDGRRFTQKMIY